MFNKKLRELAPGLVTAVGLPLPQRRVLSADHACQRRRERPAGPVGADRTAVPWPLRRRLLQAAGQEGLGPSGGLERCRHRRPGPHHALANGDARGRRRRLLRPRAAVALRHQGQHRRPAARPGTARAASTAVSTPCSSSYGPWFVSMQNHDKVAIVASGRMYKIDDWTGVMGRHFARVMEAYVACLHAHRPASIVFAEDIRPDTLKQYEAVLVVGQTVEMEPALAAALTGRPAIRRGRFRRRHVPPASWSRISSPLGLSFNHLEKDPSPAADDHAYWRIGRLCQGRRAAAGQGVGPRPAGRGGREPRGLRQRAAGRGGPLSVRGQQHHVRRSGTGAPVAGNAGLRQPGAANGAAEARSRRGPGGLRCLRRKAGPAGRRHSCKPIAAICPPAFLPFSRPPWPA